MNILDIFFITTENLLVNLLCSFVHLNTFVHFNNINHQTDKRNAVLTNGNYPCIKVTRCLSATKYL